jgi:hypothetical protein
MTVRKRLVFSLKDVMMDLMDLMNLNAKKIIVVLTDLENQNSRKCLLVNGTGVLKKQLIRKMNLKHFPLLSSFFQVVLVSSLGIHLMRIKNMRAMCNWKWNSVTGTSKTTNSNCGSQH